MVDIKALGRAGPGIRKAAEHYAKSFGPKPAPAKPNAGKPPKAPGLTATQRTQAAGNAVKFREMARRNANPGMSAQQANELERHSGLMATLPKRKTTSRKPVGPVSAKRKRGK